MTNVDFSLTHPASHIELDEVRKALAQLPAEQREVVILIGAVGMTYDEVSEMTGCPVGTIKSRLSRGRAALLRYWEEGGRPFEKTRADEAVNLIMSQASMIVRAHRALGQKQSWPTPPERFAQSRTMSG